MATKTVGARLTELTARLEQQEAELQALKSERRTRPSAAAPEQKSSRRDLFKLAGGAVAGAAGASVLGTHAALATDGGNVILGQSNAETHTTTIDATGGTGDVTGLLVKGAGASSAVRGEAGASGPGVYGQGAGGASGPGVYGQTVGDGDGVSGLGTGTGTGVTGTGGASGTGVYGQGGAGGGIGVDGLGTGNLPGVKGFGSGTGAGVQAEGGASNGPGGNFTGNSNGAGIISSGGGIGAGVSATGGGTSGNGAKLAGGGTGAPLNLVPSGTPGPPGSGPHALGDVWMDQGGLLWTCIVAGTPGTFVPIQQGGLNNAHFVAVSTQQYTLGANNGTTWVDMDATNLKLTITPGFKCQAIISANSDLWTTTATFNQDIGIFISGGAYGGGQLVAWKESGGFAGTYSPNAAFVETTQVLLAGIAYTIKLQWKANNPVGANVIMAGAGPSGPFSPTRLAALLIVSQ